VAKKTNRNKKESPSDKLLKDPAVKKILATTANAKFVESDLPNKLKISQAIITLLDDEVPADFSEEEYKFAVDVIVRGWNLGVMDENDRANEFKRLKEESTMPEEKTKQFIDFLEHIIQKKNKHFPDDKRVIKMADVRFENGHYFVSVITEKSSEP
jgi:hypothetical protein